MNKLKILIVDPISAKGHIKLNEKIIEHLNSISNIHILTIDNTHSKNQNNISFFPENIKNIKKNKFSYRIQNYLYTRYAINYFKKNNFDIIIFIAYETISMSIALIGNKKIAERLWLYEHNNIDEKNDSIIKEFFYKKLNNKAMHIVFEDYIGKNISKKYFHIPHPIYKELKTHEQESKKFIFAPSGGNDPLLSSEIIKFCENNSIYLKLKSKLKIYSNFIESSDYFDNYNQLINSCSYVLLLNNFENRVSGVLYEALTERKIIISTDCQFIREIKVQYPTLIYIIKEISDLKIIYTHKEEIIAMSKDYNKFISEHSDANIINSYSQLIKITLSQINHE